MPLFETVPLPALRVYYFPNQSLLIVGRRAS
jgi:hypothetical protein